MIEHIEAVPAVKEAYVLKHDGKEIARFEPQPDWPDCGHIHIGDETWYVGDRASRILPRLDEALSGETEPEDDGTDLGEFLWNLLFGGGV